MQFSEKDWNFEAAVKIYKFMHNSKPPPGPQKNVEPQHVSISFDLTTPHLSSCGSRLSSRQWISSLEKIYNIEECRRIT